MEFHSINNFNIQQNTPQKAGLVQNSQQQSNQIQPQIQQKTLNIQQQTINPALIFNYETAKMDNETVLRYLQNLMKLPNSIDKFVDQLNSKTSNSKLASILIENMINVKALNNFLNQNSTEAISKLMQTISMELKSGTSDIAQLKEILSILSSIQNSTNLNSNSLKEILLFYIPLNMPMINEDLNNKIQDEQENYSINNSKLSILFETINFSNLLITLNEFENTMFVDFFAPIDFPKDEFLRIINVLSQKLSFSLAIDFKEKNKNENEDKVQNFKVMTDGFISSNLLIFSHMIIKTILNIDEKHCFDK